MKTTSLRKHTVSALWVMKHHSFSAWCCSCGSCCAALSRASSSRRSRLCSSCLRADSETPPLGNRHTCSSFSINLGSPSALCTGCGRFFQRSFASACMRSRSPGPIGWTVSCGCDAGSALWLLSLPFIVWWWNSPWRTAWDRPSRKASSTAVLSSTSVRVKWDRRNVFENKKRAKSSRGRKKYAITTPKKKKNVWVK